MEKSIIDFDIQKDFDIDFNIEMDAEKTKEEEIKRILRNTCELRKQLITIDGALVSE
jgi:hypothetical protein